MQRRWCCWPDGSSLLWRRCSPFSCGAIYGGTLYAPELATVALGHLLNASLTIALAAAAASLTEHPSTAAIVTLAVTVGTWILNFVAAINGGIWQRAAGYTPTAMVAEFQHGLIRLDVASIALALTLFGLVLATIWMRLGVAVRRRVNESLALAAGTTAAIALLALITVSWDTVREPRELVCHRTMRRCSNRSPIRSASRCISLPEDPRRFDLEHRALSKLRRVLPGVQVHYISATSTGLFEQTAPHYGEIWYELGGRRAMSRVTTADGVLESDLRTCRCRSAR